MAKFNEIQIKSTLNYFKVLFFSSLLGSLSFILPIPANFLGFNFSGYAWILVLIVSIHYILNIIKKSYFPFKIWLLWFIVLFFYLIVDFSVEGLQGTLQFIVPVLIGVVSSGLKYNKLTLISILSYFKILMIITFISTTILSYIKFGILGFGPATDAHLSALSGVLVLTFYYHFRERKYLVYYFLLVLIPVLAVTRTGILIMLLIPFLHFYKFFSFKKILLLVILIPMSIYIFYLPSVQEKMFFGGKGSINELEFGSTDVNTSGRSSLNEILIKEFNKSPLFGQGPRTDYFTFQRAGLELKEAHNDYLQILTSYGIFGGVILLLTFIFLVKFIIEIRSMTGVEKILKSMFFTLFIPFILFMGTDTVLRMSYSFMNYFFAIAGIFMSVHNSNKNILKFNNRNNSNIPFI